ncbi:hypothetical protein [Arthrobacter globiformis]|uniref:hypothetical protein n=1 Tax=Arthrobacter globiformis TaxID=1665 RepID=UPI0027826083|nr:hypothetical protein [Arthrobacter globiformis]MDQ0865619.1 hypothetical protein [Arthrobacter globiformis]
MKTRAALALSVAGILLTGGAAFATTQSLSNTGPGTSDDTRSVPVTDDTATRTPVPAVSSATATAKASDDTQADHRKASAAKKASKPAEPGDDKGGLRTAADPGDDNGGAAAAAAENFVGSGSLSIEPGDDKGGLRTIPEPGDDKGGLRSDQAPRVAEPGDDHGGLRTTPEPGDDKGGDHNAAEPGDDSSGSGGHGSDD